MTPPLQNSPASRQPAPTTSREWGEWLRPRLALLQRVAASYYPESPEDLLQSTLLALFRSASRGVPMPGGDDLQAYCCTALRNKAYDWYDAQRRRRPIQAPVTDETPEPVGESFAPESLDAVGLRAKLPELLPPSQENVITMRIWGGMSFAEIGEALGVSRKTVYARFACAIRRLKELFDSDHE